jgi:hypothetical protein
MDQSCQKIQNMNIAGTIYEDNRSEEYTYNIHQLGLEIFHL